jgi:hypothetical protein
MPCVEHVFEHNNNPSRYSHTVAFLEAALCALITEVLKREGGESVIMNACKNGQVDLFAFHKMHSLMDEHRLFLTFSRLSKHEQDLIKRMIKENAL